MLISHSHSHTLTMEITSDMLISHSHSHTLTMEVTPRHSGCLMSSSSQMAEKTERFSAQSIILGLVPKTFTPLRQSGRARLLGICPPTDTMAPLQFWFITGRFEKKNVGEGKENVLREIKTMSSLFFFFLFNKIMKNPCKLYAMHWESFSTLLPPHSSFFSFSPSSLVIHLSFHSFPPSLFIDLFVLSLPSSLFIYLAFLSLFSSLFLLLFLFPPPSSSILFCFLFPPPLSKVP